MSDNVTIDTANGPVVMAAEDIDSVLFERVKLIFGAAGSAVPVSPSTPLPVATKTANFANCTQVQASGSEVTILAENQDRLGAYIFNDSTGNLFLKFGGGINYGAYTVKLTPWQFYELPTSPIYTGLIVGMWDNPTSFAAVTEVY